MNLKQSKFLAYILEESVKNGVDITFKHKRRFYSDRVLVSGEYSELKNSIKLGIELLKPNIWLGDLAHEYCHSIQAKNQTPAWKIHDKEISPKYGESSGVFFHWLTDKAKLKRSLVKTAMRRVRNMELECEKMALELLIKFDVINKIQYIKSINLYMFIYTYAFEHHKWYKRTPFRDKEILKLMPKEVLKPIMYDNLPKGFAELYGKYCV